MSGPEWGDVASWAAFALAGGAALISLKARGDSKRSAAATVRAADAAEASLAEARKSADGAVRSASAAEEALALQRDEAASRRAAEEDVRRPRVALAIVFHQGHTWHLINEGTAPARNLRLLTAFDFQAPDVPPNLILDPGDVQPLRMLAGLVGSLPTVLEFTWEGQDQPVRLRVPPKP
ncbi:hypothetical protein ACFWP3_26410 [Streptomyces sp. NPDC058525]|uniref:hypothetical protein n=1 Tax=Streptomyces sp. NPDC058525 TaxID=3346538 RepID=UPI003662A1F3